MAIHPPPRRQESADKAEEQKSGKLPGHVAIIMDGNGRWAEQRGLSREAGHRAGTENIRTIIQAFAERNIKYLTLYAFSTENWTRPKREVNSIIRLVGKVIDRELATLNENGVRLLHIGSLDGVAPDLQRRVRGAIELTKDNTRLTVTLAFNYGGRAEILEAVRRIIRDGVPAPEVTDNLFASYLDTSGIPDPDLVIRTGGEMRLSNFLLWQVAYAEYYSTAVYWPDFDEDEMDRALLAYAQRSRRFGGLGERRRANAIRNGAHYSP